MGTQKSTVVSHVAAFRLMALRRFWAAERAQRGRPRGRIAADAVSRMLAEFPAAKISVKTLYTWERLHRSFGPEGLRDGRGRPAIRKLSERVSRKSLVDLSALELLEESVRLARLALRRMRAGEVGTKE